jgi:thiol-disulfide isomerase/thioredoxin
MAPDMPAATTSTSSALPPAPSASADQRLWVACLCAEWCGACREYRPLFEQVARAHPQLRFAWVDIEDHAEIADDFDVETFPTLLIAGAEGTRFLGPLLPHAETLARLLDALQPPQAAQPPVVALLAALERQPQAFAVG